jgi:uncharacterized membrane protein
MNPTDTQSPNTKKWLPFILNRIGKGLLLFMFPIMVLVLIFEKAIVWTQSVLQPLKSQIPDERILGVGLFTLLSLLLVLSLCYAAGMLYEKKSVRKMLSFVEDNVLAFIPGYRMMQTAAKQTLQDNDEPWKVVIVSENDDLRLAIEIEECSDGYSMLFFPEPPDGKSGEMRLLPASKFKRTDIPVTKLIKLVRNYGRGAKAIPLN